jgi:hypothetical protein
MQLDRHMAKPGVPVLFELDVRYLLLLLLFGFVLERGLS